MGGVDLTVEFWMHRPKNRPKTIDVLPLTPPDLDKLVRAIGDSLVNAGVLGDDSQITDLSVSKRYAVSPALPKIYVPGYHRHEPCAVVLVQERGAS
jgi:Holliday junction resolvase RusA-like endonuclease